MQTAVVQRAQVSLFDSSKSVGVTCSTAAKWACSPPTTATMTSCQSALMAAHSPQCANIEDLPSWHVCKSSAFYEWTKPVAVSIQELQEMQGGKVLETYLVQATDSIIANAESNAFGVQYVLQPWQNNLEGPGKGVAVDVVQVTGIDERILPGTLSIGQWSDGACRISMPTSTSGGCSSAASDGCLYASTAQALDQDRYYNAAADPVIVLSLSSTDEKQTIPVCGSGPTVVLQSITDNLDDGSNLICDIIGIDVPAGNITADSDLPEPL